MGSVTLKINFTFTVYLTGSATFSFTENTFILYILLDILYNGFI